MPPAIQIGSWSIAAVPAEWEVVPDCGLRRTGANVFPSTVIVTEEVLPGGMTLERYVTNSIEIMRRLLPEPSIKGPDGFSFPDVDQAQRLEIAYQSKDERSVVQRQIYALAAGQVGIVTFTTVAEDVSNVSGAFRTIGGSLRFGQADSAKLR
jgi:hypothetical protein